MGNIFIVMPKTDNSKKISDMLRNHGMPCDYAGSSAAEVLRVVQNYNNGVVICGGNLGDMSYMELNEYLPKFFDMILMTKENTFFPYETDIVRLGMPTPLSDLMRTIDMVLENQNRLLRKYRPPVKRSKEEKAAIHDAKEILMSRNHMTEDEAHKYIQKCSMDSGTSLVEVAQSIIMLNREK